MRIGIYGAGAIGCYFGGRLGRAGVDVQLVARGRQLGALRAGPLRVRSVTGDFDVALPATDDPREIGPCDAVLLCVKSYDTDEAAAGLSPMLREDSVVVSLQNGVDNEEKLGAAIGRERVLAGVAYVFARIAEPGVVDHPGGDGSIAFGELDGERTARAERLAAVFERAEIRATLVDDVRERLWKKLVFICAHAGMTACARLPIGPIRSASESWWMFRRLADEVAALAAAEGVGLPTNVVDEVCGWAEALEPDTASSLHDDLVAGRRLELETLHGYVVRSARTHGLAAPACEAVYAILQPAWALAESVAGYDPRPIHSSPPS
jgi:2-dehydropantoate 2-reductase